MAEDQPVQYGPTRAVLTLFEYDPPVVFMIDVNNVAVTTGGLSEDTFESIRQGLANALGPLPTEGIERRDDADDEEEPGKSKGKGKGKKKRPDREKEAGKGKPDWAGNPDHPDHPRNRKDRDDDEQPEGGEIPVDPEEEPLPDVIDPESLEPAPGDVDVRDDDAFLAVTVNATATIIPAMFEQWYVETYGNENVPDPATHPDLVREYLGDPE